MTLIKWRRGSRAGLLARVKSGMEQLPDFVSGRGLGVDWPLPPLTPENLPISMAPEALPALVAVYEEYVDRYLVTCDYDQSPRTWLRSAIPADPGILEYVFPLLSGAAADCAIEVMLVRLVWLIQQAPGLASAILTPDEITATTSTGTLGIREGNKVQYRFAEGGLSIYGHLGFDAALRAGHTKVFNNAMKRLNGALDEEGRVALTLLSTRLRTKPLLKALYGDPQMVIEGLGFKQSVEDKVLSIELALMRNERPADVLLRVLVPEHMSARECREMFGIPWKQSDRDKVPGAALVEKMPLLRQILETQ